MVIPTIKVEHDNGWWADYNWESFSYNPSRTVSIYTQITWGNPFNTIHNVRWHLDNYEPEKWDSYKDDIIYNYGSFKIPDGVSQKSLTVFDYNLDKYYNTNNSNRKGFGYLFHKRTPEWGLDFVKKFGATEIPHYNGKQNLDYLLKEFNNYEYILTFDDKSYYTTAAALCGTKAIILNPHENLTPNEYRQLNRFHKVIKLLKTKNVVFWCLRKPNDSYIEEIEILKEPYFIKFDDKYVGAEDSHETYESKIYQESNWKVNDGHIGVLGQQVMAHEVLKKFNHNYPDKRK
jgi:hypothetical protein